MDKLWRCAIILGMNRMLKHLAKAYICLTGCVVLIEAAFAVQENPLSSSDVVRELKQENAKLRKGLQIRILPAIALVETRSGQFSVARSTFKQALALAVPPKKFSSDYGRRDSWWFTDLLAIAEYQHKAKQEDASRATITKALELAQVLSCNDSDFLTRLGLVAVTQVQLGDVAGVERTLSRINELSRKQNKKFGNYNEALVIQNVAEAFMNQEKHSAAKTILHEFVRRKGNWELPAMAVIFAKLGDIETTEKILKKVFKAQKTVKADDPHFNLLVNTETMLKVAEGFWAAGRNLSAKAMLSSAMRAIERMKDQKTEESFGQAYWLWPKVAVVQAKFGKLQLAQRMLNQIPIEELKREPLQVILETHLQMGEVEKARKTAQHPAIDLERAIETQARHGDFKGVKISLKALKKTIESNKGLQRYKTMFHINEWPRDYQNAVRMVAKARIKIGEYHETLDWARNQSTPDLRTYALLGVVEGFVSEYAGK